MGVYKYTDALAYFCVGGCICNYKIAAKICFLGTICCGLFVNYCNIIICKKLSYCFCYIIRQLGA